MARSRAHTWRAPAPPSSVWERQGSIVGSLAGRTRRAIVAMVPQRRARRARPASCALESRAGRTQTPARGPVRVVLSPRRHDAPSVPLPLLERGGRGLFWRAAPWTGACPSLAARRAGPRATSEAAVALRGGRRGPGRRPRPSATTRSASTRPWSRPSMSRWGRGGRGLFWRAAPWTGACPSLAARRAGPRATSEAAVALRGGRRGPGRRPRPSATTRSASTRPWSRPSMSHWGRGARPGPERRDRIRRNALRAALLRRGRGRGGLVGGVEDLLDGPAEPLRQGAGGGDAGGVRAALDAGQRSIRHLQPLSQSAHRLTSTAVLDCGSEGCAGQGWRTRHDSLLIRERVQTHHRSGGEFLSLRGDAPARRHLARATRAARRDATRVGALTPSGRRAARAARSGSGCAARHRRGAR